MVRQRRARARAVARAPVRDSRGYGLPECAGFARSRVRIVRLKVRSVKSEVECPSRPDGCSIFSRKSYTAVSAACASRSTAFLDTAEAGSILSDQKRQRSWAWRFV